MTPPEFPLRPSSFRQASFRQTNSRQTSFRQANSRLTSFRQANSRQASSRQKNFRQVLQADFPIPVVSVAEIEPIYSLPYENSDVNYECSKYLSLLNVFNFGTNYIKTFKKVVSSLDLEAISVEKVQTKNSIGLMSRFRILTSFCVLKCEDVFEYYIIPSTIKQ